MSTDTAAHDVVYANPATRDAFLEALDKHDPALSLRLARDLVTCSNALPGLTREALGLPVGATYGAAARYILARAQSQGQAPADEVAKASDG